MQDKKVYKVGDIYEGSRTDLVNNVEYPAKEDAKPIKKENKVRKLRTEKK